MSLGVGPGGISATLLSLSIYALPSVSSKSGITPKSTRTNTARIMAYSATACPDLFFIRAFLILLIYVLPSSVYL